MTNEATTTKTVKSEKVAPTERKCALHPVNFADEPQMRPISEFYGGALTKSSYCRRCMLEHHRQRRERISSVENREKNLYNEFASKLIAAAKVAIEFDAEEAQALFAREAQNALSELRAKINN